MSNRSQWIGIGAVVLLAGAGWLWWQAGSGSPPGEAAADSRPATVAPREAERAAPHFETQLAPAEPLTSAEATQPTTGGASDTASVADPPKLETLARLVGRVTLRGSDTPVAGLTVHATLSSKALVPAFTHEATDADGRFQFALSEAAHVTRLAVQAGPDTRGLLRELDLDLALGAELVQDLEVSRGARVSGHVVDGSEQPVPGARVLVWNQSSYLVEPDTRPDQEGTTDAAGAFSLGGLGPNFVLSADAPGLAALARLTGELASGAQVEGVSLVLGPARELRGIVLGQNDQPLPECTVSVEPRAGDWNQDSGVAGVFRIPPINTRIQNDTDGRFVIPDVAALTYHVDVRCERHLPWEGNHAPGEPELVAQLDGGATLTGEVLSVRGGPVAQAEVWAATQSHGPWAQRLQSASTDAEGRFELAGLPVDDPKALLEVRGLGHAIRIEQPLTITETGPNHVRVVLDEARALGGVVVDASDQPVAGARVSIQGDRILPMDSRATVSVLPTWEYSLGLAETTTDSQGAFRIDQLYDGLFELRVTEPGGNTIAAKLEAHSGDEKLRIVLGTGAGGVTLVGHVTDGLTGLPIEAFDIIPMLPASSGGGMTGNDHDFESPDGAYRLTGLEPGPIQVQAKAPGYSTLRLPEQDYDAGEHRIDLALLAERMLRLRIVDEDKQPVSAKLSFLDESGATLFVRDSPNRGVTNLETDDAGEAVAMGLPAARITVHVKQGWFGGGQDFRFDLRNELHGTQVLVLGEDEEVSVLVFFFGSSQPPAFDPAGQGFQAAMEGLHGQVLDGTVGPIATPITVRALAADGKAVAEQHIDPGAPPADLSTPVPDVAGVCNLRLTLPAEPLEIEVSAAGYETARRSWQPDRSSDEDDVVVLVLRRL